MLLRKIEPVGCSQNELARRADNLPASPAANQLLMTLTKLSKGNSSEQGMSLLECLIAIVIIAVVITTFTPAIFVAVGTRIQNRRAEQALQLAQAEVDRVRRTMERGVYSDIDLPPQGLQGNSTFRTESGPGSTAVLPANQLYPSRASAGVTVDVNGDGTNDFIVQTYRSPGVKNNQSSLIGFNMGVRIYSYLANPNLGNLQTRQGSLGFSTAVGQQKTRPLAVMYTSVVRSDVRTSLQCYHEFLGTPIAGSLCDN